MSAGANRYPGRCRCGVLVAAKQGELVPLPSGRGFVLCCQVCKPPPDPMVLWDGTLEAVPSPLAAER